jgi:hypothetical protein
MHTAILWGNVHLEDRGDGNGSGSCPTAGFDLSGVEPLGSAVKQLVIWTK